MRVGMRSVLCAFAAAVLLAQPAAAAAATAATDATDATDATAGAAAATDTTDATAVAGTRPVDRTGVIVGYDGADPAAAERAVRRAGGTVGARLGLVDSFAATVPAGSLGALRVAPGVTSVTPDGQVRMTGKNWLADGASTTMASVTKMIGAQDVWMKKDAAGRTVTGKGVGVAIIDSGIVPAKGLADAARVVNGPDLSFEAVQPNLRNLDTFGHGTHMAGIIGGRDPEVTPGKEVNTDAAKFVGVAPDATLVNVKVAATDGAVDVSQVIAAIDWVVSHRNDPGLNIRVLNLSFGTDSVQDPRLDPLSHAVEAAWRKGIVVVVAVGNDGPTRTQVSMPAANKYVIAVGAADHVGTEPKGDDVVASFSTRGSTTRAADLLAPGRSIVSLRTPNSFIDSNYPAGLLGTTTDPTLRFFKGSGTSQATAVVSGAAALLLQARPTLTPDEVKRLLVTTTDAMPKADPIGRGAGQLNIRNALGAPSPGVTATQTFPASTGLGTLEAARGSAHVADPFTGTELTGEKDIMGQAWNKAAWTASCTAGTAWTGGTWNARTWSGGSWSGTSWTARTWSTGAWTGNNWAGTAWTGSNWMTFTATGTVWDGRTWSGRTWSGRTWSGRTWSGGYWSGAIWE
jgi:serine protease AprX